MRVEHQSEKTRVHAQKPQRKNAVQEFHLSETGRGPAGGPCQDLGAFLELGFIYPDYRVTNIQT